MRYDTQLTNLTSTVRCKKWSGGIDALVAIRHSEEAGELVDNHIDIHVSEEGTKQESGTVNQFQSSETSFRSEAA